MTPCFCLALAGFAVPADLLLERLMVQNFVAIPAPAINRDAFLRVGGMDKSLWYTADWDLYLKLACAGPVYYAHEALTCFRVHGDSQTMTGSRSQLFLAVSSIVTLGPIGIWRYLRDSRLVERVAPRLRARFGQHL